MAILTHSKTSKTRLSTNFKASEFACHGKGCCNTSKIDENLVKYLEKIRKHFGAPVTITSAYRCPKHNKAVGGATSSYHARGQAADIVVRNVPSREVAKYAESIGILGIGLYETHKDGHFTHIDTRTKKSFWYGQKQASRTTFGGSKKPIDPELIQFIKYIQEAFDLTVDGAAGPDTLAGTLTLSSKLNNKHKAVYYVQLRLKQLGYVEIGKVDGEAGPMFTSAVAHFQLDNGCKADGEITARGKTWKKLLGME